MTIEEKNTWAFGIIAALAYLTYAALVLTVLPGDDLVQRPYATAMLAPIGGAILAGIIAGILIGVVTGGQRVAKDQRDREIFRLGEHVGQAFVVIGALAALLLALVEADHFWIANAVYLCFALSAVLSALTRILAYRKGVPAW